jgi:ribosomal protein L37AE/L43A
MSSDTNQHDEEHVHETGDHELTECPACGKPITGADDLEKGETVPELTSVDSRSVMVGRASNDLWLCKGCGATLGVRRRDA